MPCPFAPTGQALDDTIAAIDVNAYARSRNHLDGRVTRLSPYLTHGYTSVPALMQRLGLGPQDKLAFEFGWREFFQHVWHRSGDAILSDMRPGLAGVRYAPALPADVREARTGIAAIDKAVTGLYETGYLHNHARMWLASYVVHMRKVHWRAGADWLYGHLLDGDLASNHLSWQWVAATFSDKPYLFNAENVAKYAPPEWHCAGSAIDVGYEALGRLARSDQALGTAVDARGVAEPPLLPSPTLASAPPGLPAAARVRLVHPWTLDGAPFDGVRLGVIHLPFHARFPWSARRWRFVTARMANVSDAVFVGDLAGLTHMLPATAMVESTATLYPGYRELLPALCGTLHPSPRHFANPPEACRSFSAFWQLATGGNGERRGWHR